MIRNFILDWSGTLADDLGAVILATNGVLGHYGKEALDREQFRSIFRLPYTEFYQDVLPSFEVEEVKTLYLKHFPADPAAVPLLPHAREFLQFAAATGRRMILLSSAPEEHFKAQATANGVLEFFEEAWCGVLDKRIAISSLIQQHGFLPEETAFIGDMRHDMDAAKAAGVLAIATATGYESPNVLMQSDPDMLVKDLSHLPRIFGSEFVGGTIRPVATVGALIFNRQHEILLVRTHKWRDRWGIAGGKIRRGESCEDALRRETLEETGLELDDIRFLLVQDCIEPEEFESSAHFLLLNYVAVCRDDTVNVQLNDEAEAYCWVSLYQALEMDLNQPTRILIEEVRKRELASGSYI